MKEIRIAAAVFPAPTAEVQRNLDRMAPLIETAASRHVKIICFPEMNITGYTSGPKVREAAEPVPGTVTRALSDMAADNDVAILAGMAEKDDAGRIYATHLVVHPDRKVEAYRKLHTAPPEKEVYSPGSDVPVFEAFGVSFGIQLCYDAHFPELSGLMAQKGADILFMPHASPRGTAEDKYRSWMRHLPARAFDNSLFVIACNQSGTNANGLSFPGISLAIDPSGNVISKNLSDKESLLVADLSPDALDRVRNHKMRFFFPNRRPDLYERARNGSVS